MLTKRQHSVSEKSQINDDNIWPKLLNLILWSTILITIFIALITEGYQTYHLNNRLVPGNIQTMRAVSLFFIAWWACLTAWTMVIGTRTYLSSHQKIWWLVICSFVPYLNLLFLGFVFQNLTPRMYAQWFKKLFGHGTNKNSRCSWQYILMAFVAVIMSPEFVFIFINHYNWNPDQRYGTYLNNLWFYSFQYFTIQTNLFCAVMAWLYIFYPQWKVFDGKTYHIWSVSYLFVVALVFDGFLLPNSIRSGSTAHWSHYEWARLMWEHVVNPIFFCGSGLIIFLNNREQFGTWRKVVGSGLVIPSIYLFYCLTVPFMTYQTVYSWLSNANPNVINPHGSLLTYGKWYICWLFASSLLIFMASLSFFWGMNKLSFQRFLKREQTLPKM